MGFLSKIPHPHIGRATRKRVGIGLVTSVAPVVGAALIIREERRKAQSAKRKTRAPLQKTRALQEVFRKRIANLHPMVQPVMNAEIENHVNNPSSPSTALSATILPEGSNVVNTPVGSSSPDATATVAQEASLFSGMPLLIGIGIILYIIFGRK